MKKLILGALATVAAVAPAQAAVTVDSSIASNNVSVFTNSEIGAITFDPTPAGLSGGTIVSGSSPDVFAVPYNSTPADNKYLSVGANQNATLAAGDLFNTVSLYWGSIDGYNDIDFLVGNAVVGTFNGGLLAPANGAQTDPETNRYVTLRSSIAFDSVKFRSTENAFELDNVKFSNAVPEPATWGMMLVGFGAVGSAMRRRRVMKPSFV